jgi:hypothetical protein
MLNIYKSTVLFVLGMTILAEGKRPIAPYHTSLKVQSTMEVKEKSKRVLSPIVRVTCQRQCVFKDDNNYWCFTNLSPMLVTGW